MKLWLYNIVNTLNKGHLILYFKMVKCVIYEFHLKKTKKRMKRVLSLKASVCVK